MSCLLKSLKHCTCHDGPRQHTKHYYRPLDPLRASSFDGVEMRTVVSCKTQAANYV